METVELAIVVIAIVIIIGYLRYVINKSLMEKKRAKDLKNGIRINRYKVIETPKPIYSLEVGKEVNGGFVLGFGSMDEDIKYYFYVDKGKGKQLKSVDVADCILVETNAKKPNLTEREYEENEDWTVDNSKEIFIGYKLETKTMCEEEGEFIENILYVPKNTIKRKFLGNLR